MQLYRALMAPTLPQVRRESRFLFFFMSASVFFFFWGPFFHLSLVEEDAARLAATDPLPHGPLCLVFCRFKPTQIYVCILLDGHASVPSWVDCESSVDRTQTLTPPQP